MALLCGLAALWLAGCTEPQRTDANDTSCAQDPFGEAEPRFARDPGSGTCVALASCVDCAEQHSWATCPDNPCVGLGEASCLRDARCQPAYALPDIKKQPGSCPGQPSSERFGSGAFGFCSIFADRDPPLGVNNGALPKHGSWKSGCRAVDSLRQYAGCRAVPQTVDEQHCSVLAREQCLQQPLCTMRRGADSPGGERCGAVRSSCEFADQKDCLSNPDCQPIGTGCYCPPGATCDCGYGDFLGCENNDRLRRCSTDAECDAGERCDNDEDCIIPRTHTTLPIKPAGPGAPDCLGACVPIGCTGMGESRCNEDPACDAGSYKTVCGSAYYGSTDSSGCAASATGTGRTCSCTTEFAACAALAPNMNLRPERSLLVRDPEIIDDPTFSLLAVMTQLAPAGQVDAFAQALLSQVGASQQVASGATTKARNGFSKLYQELTGGKMPLAQRYSAMMATTALINRLDLATTGDCGEARLSFAMTSAYTDSQQRMTLIVELKVPDDGSGCTTVAQKWAELSLLDDVTQRRRKLIALYAELLKPANLGQIRTNEFVNRVVSEPWELREFHLRPGNGLPELAPVAQTMDPSQADTPALLSWLRANAASLQAGTALIPVQFLAGSSTEDGIRLKPFKISTDPEAREIEKSVNGLACAGCHLTETHSPFVHIGERLAKKIDRAYRPVGRAVIDEFLQKELVKRTALLKNVLAGSRELVAVEWRPRIQPRVH